jgi:hypothetical protein
MMTAPIALIVFNRPDHTARVLEALAANEFASETDLYVYADAPRGEHDHAAVRAVKALLPGVRGFKTVNLIERPFNFGCTKNVLSAVTETLKMHDRCIVVEDDIQTAPQFLSYMNQALTHYADESRLYAIGAYAHSFVLPRGYVKDYFVCQRHCSWGWGTWKRAWTQLIVDLSIMDEGMADKATRTAFKKACGEDLLRTYRRVPDIWDLRLTYKAWTLGLYTLYPVESLVRNIGKDGSGTNYNGAALHSVDDMPFPKGIPALSAMPEPDEVVIKAFLKPTRKLLWRRVGIVLAKTLGVYDPLLRCANRKIG